MDWLDWFDMGEMVGVQVFTLQKTFGVLLVTS